MERVAPSITRRSLLAGAGSVGLSALAGCSERFWSRAENAAPEQIELTIKTVPADDDNLAAMIMSQLRENFQAAGIDAAHEPIAEPELYREVLINGDYDVFVLRHSGLDEFDALHGLLHSEYVSERGWQNPFHFSDITADELLEDQRSMDGTEREETLTELFDYLTDAAPFTTVAYPDRVGGARRSIDAPYPPQRASEFIDLLSREPDDGPQDRPLSVGVYGEGLTERLNPIVVDRNRIHGVMGLLYDPLARRSMDAVGDPDASTDYVPWLAEEINWDDNGRLSATVTLRSELTWHDGESLDADDVAFTFRFLQDTSLGSVEGAVPAPQYRNRQTVIDDSAQIDVIDDRTVEIPFGTTARPAAARLLTVPILPQHIWEPRSEVVAERQTRALVTDNEEPIGSGLFEFVDASTTELLLEPFDDHVLRARSGLDSSSYSDVLENFSQFEGIRYRIDPNVGAMLDALIEGDIDVTSSSVPPDEAGPITESSSVSLITATTNSFYMIGYNTHHPELGNPNFRRILSKLIDREFVVAEFFNDFAEAPSTDSALFGYRDAFDESTPPTPPLRFPGSDGEIDVDRVRQLFTEAGYRYEVGALLE